MKKGLLHILSVCFLVQIAFNTELFAQRNMEKLDRGLVAVQTNNGIFLSWRMFGTDSRDIAFNIYRNGTKVNNSPITGATNMIDASGSSSSSYTVKPVVGGVEQAVGGNASVWESQVREISLSHRPSGSHRPNDINVGDLDGDGQYELVVKWYPDNAQDNSRAGHTDNTYLAAYKLDGTFLWIIDLGQNIRSGAHYTQHLVGDYDLDGYAEVACKTAPGTRDGAGNFLNSGPAASDDDGADYANGDGYVLSGPEYVTIFNGETGEEMATENYSVPRGRVSDWGDSYGNRLDRFNATNAYIDGVKPSMIFQRGYYTRMVVAAWDWDGTNLTNTWTFDSDDSGNGGAYGDGNHSVMAADVDGDGYDEIIPGAACIDHDGTLKWTTNLGHGDANHIGDFDPENPGLEIFLALESDASEVLIDGNSGNVIWRNQASGDNGRGMTADMDARYSSHEMWSSRVGGVKTADNDVISSNKPGSTNFRVYWDADLLDELLNDNDIDKWNGNGTSRLEDLRGYSCNGTKSTPNISADLIGDWREEVILHDNGSTLYLHTTIIPTEHKLYTLMHDPIYRNAISWQQSSYNQPPHLGFWLRAGVENAPIPDIVVVGGVDCNGVEGGSAFIDDCGECVGGNTGKEPCIVDCNGDRDGTATVDACGVCSGGNTGISPCTAAIQGEDFCEAVGGFEDINTGFVGDGYLNFDNEMGASANWKLYSNASQSIMLTIIYANGGDDARPMSVSVNGTEQTVFAGNQTASWTSWETAEITLTVSSGINEVTFTSTAAEGGPNIDAFFLYNDGVMAVDCDVRSLVLKAGWNIIGYPLGQSADVEDALESILPYLETVKDFDGFWDASIDPQLHSLHQLQWSQGYLIKVSQNCQLVW
ncbi:MAG: hypothetical protein PF481_06485 [Bacteroidales bacterium]|jgi:hypothetical protein|nr:hypothetical protein [Bacteroidales bacterium]